jgi:AraC-like DNA-binding protein
MSSAHALNIRGIRPPSTVGILRERFGIEDVTVPGARSDFHATTVVPAGSVAIADVTLTDGVRVRYPALDSYRVVVPVTGRAAVRASDSAAVAADPGVALVVDPDDQGAVHDWCGQSRLLVLAIEAHAMRSHRDRLNPHPGSPVTRLGPLVTVGHAPASAWTGLLRQLVTDHASGHGVSRNDRIWSLLTSALITGLLLLSDPQLRDGKRGSLSGVRPAAAAVLPESVRAAVSAMRDDPSRPFTADELARVSGVGARALQRGFQQHLGTTPLGYLRELRLAAVHERLRATGPATTTVADAARRFGFQHLGRFADLYRRQYGVTPSETLRSSG